MEKLTKVLIALFMVAVLWTGLVNVIQSFKCTSMTRTQIFLRIPKSIILDFKTCE